MAPRVSRFCRLQVGDTADYKSALRRQRPFPTCSAAPAITRLACPFFLAALVFCAIAAMAQTTNTDFEAGNKFYEQGKYPEAAAAYEKLVQAGRTSAAVYYNLGNAFFKAGQFGKALSAYHRAEQLDPRDPDLRANLQFARDQIQGPTFEASRWQRWLGHLTLNEWSVLAAIAVWIWFLLLASLQWRPQLRRALRGGLIGLGIATLALCAGLGAAVFERRMMPTALVITRQTEVRRGPLDESPAAFLVHDGAELRVLDKKDDWLQVSAGPNRIGWLRRNQVLMGS
jgi:tetratricopeptide (TPR) repeat protein